MCTRMARCMCLTFRRLNEGGLCIIQMKLSPLVSNIPVLSLSLSYSYTHVALLLILNVSLTFLPSQCLFFFFFLFFFGKVFQRINL